MRMSRLAGTRFKEKPAEAALDCHAFLLRGGYARDMGHGEWALLPPGHRVMERIEGTARDELTQAGVQPVDFPWPPETPAETRWRTVVQLCARETHSYSQLPFALGYAGNVFRDGQPIRGGLLQSRVFRMLETYSFCLNEENRAENHAALREASRRWLARCGIEDAVCADSGLSSEALFVPCESGDATVLRCGACGYSAAQDWACAPVAAYPEASKPLDRVHTPGTKSIADLAAFLGIEARQTAKAVFYEYDQGSRLLMALVRGDLDVSDAKLTALFGTPLVPASETLIRTAGAEPGFASPLGLDRSRLRVVADPSIRAANNLVTGANERDFHIRNFNLERDASDLEIADIALAVPGSPCRCGQGTLEPLQGYEAGRVLSLPEEAVADWSVDGPDNQPRTPLLTVLRLGLGRLMAVIMERHRDAYGPVWPASIAPWAVHVLALPGAGVMDAAEKIYADSQAEGIEVLLDDRGLRPGVQFAEADLLGIPWRVIVGEKILAQGQVELKRRGVRESEFVPYDAAVSILRNRIRICLEDETPNHSDSCVDLAGDLFGTEGRPADLSANPRHMEGFGT